MNTARAISLCLLSAVIGAAITTMLMSRSSSEAQGNSDGKPAGAPEVLGNQAVFLVPEQLTELNLAITGGRPSGHKQGRVQFAMDRYVVVQFWD